MQSGSFCQASAVVWSNQSGSVGMIAMAQQNSIDLANENRQKGICEKGKGPLDSLRKKTISGRGGMVSGWGEVWSSLDC